MSKKENVSIIRNDDFESIEEELAQAMSLLEESNTRVLDVLTSETSDTESGEDTPEDPPASDEAVAEEEQDAPAAGEEPPEDAP